MWIWILDIFPKCVFERHCSNRLYVRPFHNWLFQDELHNPFPVRHKQMIVTFYQEKRRGREKRDEREETVNYWMWKAIGEEETAWQGILSLLCSLLCSGFKPLPERWNTEFMQLFFFFFLLVALAEKKTERKTGTIHKSSHSVYAQCLFKLWHKVWISLSHDSHK